MEDALARRPMQAEDASESPARIPPQALDAERSVLGAMLISRDAIAGAIQHLGEAAFYREAHRKIWRAVVALFDRNEAADLVTVAEELRRRKELEAIGGITYLTSLDQYVATAANIEHYCKIVNEKATLRRLIEVGTTIVSDSYDQREDPSSLLDRAEQSIFAISDDRLRTGFQPMRSLVLQGFSAIEEYRQRKVHVTGVPTGFYDLDELTAGLQKSDFIVIGGRPSMGKTSFAMNIAENVAVHAKPAERHAVAIFSLEMSKESLVQRMMCSVARVDIHKIRRGFASKDEYKRLQDAAARLHEAPIYIDDSAAIGILEMRAKARRLVSEMPLGMIVVDYLQLVRGPDSSENRQQEISAISRSLKALAKELQVPVVALSQLSRAVETRGGSKRPMLSDLRECVTGETPVLLTDGRRVPIRDLVGTEPNVWALGEDGNLVAARSDRVWRVGRRPVFRVRLASGRSITATAKHRLYAGAGWTRVADLVPGDRLGVAREDVHRVSMASAGRRPALAGSSHFAFAPSLATVADYAEILDDDRLREFCRETLFWDRVVAIEPAGEEEVFDLTVPGPASWLADGIVSHNSGAVEQDSDLVIFVYRPDAYETDPAKRDGKAELIIAKQRNGPTGTVEMAFLSECTRFDSLRSVPEPRV